MRTGKESREEEEYEDEEFGSKKTRSSANTNINNDGKNNDKAKAIRSKHSVAEQRRRSKINERFQLLRDLIPNPDQKRDTASFLLEVIEYVQFLQEKVQKYEGSWSSEPTKLMPWRNSHWRVQSFVDHPQASTYDSGPVSTFSGKLDVNDINISPSIITSALNHSEADAIRDVASKAVDKGMSLPDRGDNVVGQPVQSTECLISNDTPNEQDNVTIEGGTINISSVYSHGLLNSLTQALQKTGLDLSHANISVQIDLGKRTNRGLTSSKEPQNSSATATTHLRDVSSREVSDPVQKRPRK